jgi:hypothetical protein
MKTEYWMRDCSRCSDDGLSGAFYRRVSIAYFICRRVQKHFAELKANLGMGHAKRKKGAR